MRSMRLRMRTGVALPILCMSMTGIIDLTWAQDEFAPPYLIRPPGKPIVQEEDYFSAYSGNPCDFETNGDFGRVSCFGAGISKKTVENGVLKITTGNRDNWIAFGRWLYPDGESDAPDENIGFGWPRRYVISKVKLRVRQSQQKMLISVGCRGTHGAEGNGPGRIRWVTEGIPVNGKDWRNVYLPINFDRGTPTRAMCIKFETVPSLGDTDLNIASSSDKAVSLDEFTLEEKEKPAPVVDLANDIEIDSIQIVRQNLPVYYRKEFDLDANPVHARIRINIPTEHFIYVNGELVQHFHGFLVKGVNPVVDVAPFLKQGKNVIAVGCPDTWKLGWGTFEFDKAYYELVCEGVALTEDGKYVSLNSGEGWLGRYVVGDQKNWFGVDADHSGWEPVVVGKAESLVSGPATYVGPLVTSRDNDPIFRLSKGVDLRFVCPKGFRITYEWIDEMKELEPVSGVLAVESNGPGLGAHVFSRKTERNGVWELRLKLFKAGDEPVATRAMEVAVVGPVNQNVVRGGSFTDGMRLTKIVEIDCTLDVSAKDVGKGPGLSDMMNEDGGNPEMKVKTNLGEMKFDDVVTEEKSEEPAEIIDASARLYHMNAVKGARDPSVVVETGIGSYRESRDIAWSGFGYVFPVKNLHKPHLVEIEYPDDKSRLMMAKVFCAGSKQALETPEAYEWDWSWDQRWYAGVATGGTRFPNSNTFKKIYLIFWPDRNRQINSIQLITEEKGKRAAARSINVYEIDDLPAMDLPPSPDRLYGMFLEREHLMPTTFHSGAFNRGFKAYENSYVDKIGRLRDWYMTYENMVKYFRFAGQNVFIPGFFMYDGIYFPEVWGLSKSSCRKPTEHFRLMAAMFEENDLNILIGAQFMNSLPAMEECWPTNWEVRNQGKDTVLSVNVDGRQSLYSGSAGSGNMDYQHPLVERDLMRTIDKFIEYGRDYKSVIGIWLYTADVGFPSVPTLYTMGGIRNSSLAWALNDRIIAAFEKASGKKIPVDSADSDRFMKRYRYFEENSVVREEWIDFRCREICDQMKRILARMREARPDWKLYVQPGGPAPVELAKVRKGEMSFGEASRIRGYDYAMYDDAGIVNNAGTYVRTLDDTGKDWETDVGIGEKDGLFYVNRWPTPAHSQAVLPVEPYGAYDFIRAFRYFDPSAIVFGKADVVMISGGEQNMRPFIRAFRALPPGPYTRPASIKSDAAAVIRQSRKDDGLYMYIANLEKHATRLRMRFDVDVVARDLGNDADLGQGNEILAEIGPYALKSLLVTPENAEIIEATRE